jgi:hypothetical protein
MRIIKSNQIPSFQVEMSMVEIFNHQKKYLHFLSIVGKNCGKMVRIGVKKPTILIDH